MLIGSTFFLQLMPVLYNRAGHSPGHRRVCLYFTMGRDMPPPRSAHRRVSLPPKQEFFVLRSLTRACRLFFFSVCSVKCLRCVCVVVCLSLCTYLFAVLWQITAAAARHEGRVNFGPTARRSNAVVTICRRLLRRGAMLERCRDLLQLPVE